MPGSAASAYKNLQPHRRAYQRLLWDLSSTSSHEAHANAAMDGLSAAAGVIAVIQISEYVASLCSKYLKAVQNAKSDIERLQGELSSLQSVLEGAQKLLDSPGGAMFEYRSSCKEMDSTTVIRNLRTCK